MTDVLWIDITICVLCSTLGGLIVATLFEFNPYGPNKVARAVLITIWLMLLGVVPLIIVGYLWGQLAVFLGIGVEFVIGLILAMVIATVQEAEKKARDN